MHKDKVSCLNSVEDINLFLYHFLALPLMCTELIPVCFIKNDLKRIIFQTFMCLFIIRKINQQKTLSS